jgi:hypothetical protein
VDAKVNRATSPRSRRQKLPNGFIKCKGPCGKYKPPSQFYGRKRETPNGTIWHPDPECKLCQHDSRVEAKYADPARWIIEQRAQSHAGRFGFGLTRAFMMDPRCMNYESLIAPLNGILIALDEGLEPPCSCGHPYRNESDIQIDHRSPPRRDLKRADYARLHSRNLGFGCTSCNVGKNDDEFNAWLDSEEEKRQSAIALNNAEAEVEDLLDDAAEPPSDDDQLELFK